MFRKASPGSHFALAFRKQFGFVHRVRERSALFVGKSRSGIEKGDPIDHHGETDLVLAQM